MQISDAFYPRKRIFFYQRKEIEEIKGILIAGEYLFEIEFVYDFSFFFSKKFSDAIYPRKDPRKKTDVTIVI